MLEKMRMIITSPKLHELLYLPELCQRLKGFRLSERDPKPSLVCHIPTETQPAMRDDEAFTYIVNIDDFIGSKHLAQS